MQFRRQSKDEESVNLTPLIDVVFLLLIFFMVSTTFTKETHLKLELPSAEGEPMPEIAEADKIEIVINADGGYTVNGKPLINKQLNTLMAAIEKLSQKNNELPFIITADAKVPYEAVVTAMDVAGRLGFVNLKVTTKRPEIDAP